MWCCRGNQFNNIIMHARHTILACSVYLIFSRKACKVCKYVCREKIKG